MTKTKNEIRSELGMICVVLIWGLGFPITEIAINKGFGTFTILGARFLFGTSILSVIFFNRYKKINMNYIKAGLFTGVFLFLGFYLQTHGLKYTTSANNAFLTQVAVVFTPFIVWVVFKTKPSIYAFIAAFTAIIGILILVGMIDFMNMNIGDLLTLGCALTVSFHVVSTQYFLHKYKLDPILYTLIQFITVLLICLIFIKSESLPVSNSIFSTIWPLIFLGVLNTAFGFTVQTVAIKYLNSTRTSVIVSTEALIGTIGAAIILKDKITVNVIIGGMLIIMAVIISETHLSFLRNKKSD